jgi:putative ABC transport system permease protein
MSGAPMRIVRLAMAYAWRRPLSTLLVIVLLAIGVATIALTLILARELDERLTRDAAGIDLVVGAKGSPLQLVLAGVYHVDVPPGNIALSAIGQLRANPQIAEVVPLALGDSLRGFRIVGTEPSFVDRYGGTLREGSLWGKPQEAVLGSAVARTTGLAVGDTFAGSHGLAEGGGEHAGAPYRVSGILAPTGTVLDRLVLTAIASVWAVHDDHHADTEAGVKGTGGDVRSGSAPGADAHAEGVHAAEAHAKEAPHGADSRPDEHRNGALRASEHAPRAGSAPAAAAPAREVTLALVRYRSPLAAASLARAINHDTAWVAASPAYETARLLAVFGAGVDLVRGFALLLMAASGLMLFVALAQAFEDRRYDLAILRTLGASRWQVAAVLLIESTLLAAVGAALGLVLAHAAALGIGIVLPEAAPLAAAARRWAPEEWVVVAIALAAGILAALWPAWRAARLDVAATLADN